jgi:2-dehydropantoate 2-reductase
MLQDVLRGARTEVGVINRAIVEKGAALGVETPCNRFLSEIIEALEATAAHRID